VRTRVQLQEVRALLWIQEYCQSPVLIIPSKKKNNFNKLKSQNYYGRPNITFIKKLSILVRPVVGAGYKILY
jgi:hypothetical protein